MSIRGSVSVTFLSLVISAATPVVAQVEPDPAIAAAVAEIKAFDNHAHPVMYQVEGDPPDTEIDALSLDEMEPFAIPARLNPANPEYLIAWRELFGFSAGSEGLSKGKDYLAVKQRAVREKGEGYPAWILSKLGIETMIANRVALGSGLVDPRFKWVSFVDALLFPLNNEGLKKPNKDKRSFFLAEERLLTRYVKESGLAGRPATLDAYLAKVVRPTLERHRKAGALGVKFEVGYLRHLDFGDPPKAEAQRVFAAYAKGGVPPAPSYKKLQDYLFREIAREAGRLGLTVHIHVSAGAGSYYSLAGSNPLLLEPVFDDPSLRATTFVLVHGGWPFTRETGVLLGKPNVYADFSAQTFLETPRGLSQTLRTWLSYLPEKVLFGTDAFPIIPEVSWEETAWLDVMTARKALALALTGMVADGDVTRERAIELAQMVLRGNARKLYGLDRDPGPAAAPRADAK